MRDAVQTTDAVSLPHPVDASLAVGAAGALMRAAGLDTLVVVDHGRVGGLLTERHLLRGLAVEPAPAQPTTVGDLCARHLTEVMTPDPQLVDVEATAAQAAAIMLRAGVDASVALGPDGVAGVVSGRDLAAAGERRAPTDVAVAEVCVEVGRLGLDDDLERAVALSAAAGGRPVPVVHDHPPVGTVRLHPGPGPADRGAKEAAPVLPTPPPLVRRPRGGRRFYARRPRPGPR